MTESINPDYALLMKSFAEMNMDLLSGNIEEALVTFNNNIGNIKTFLSRENSNYESIRVNMANFFKTAAQAMGTQLTLIGEAQAARLNISSENATKNLITVILRTPENVPTYFIVPRYTLMPRKSSPETGDSTRRPVFLSSENDANLLIAVDAFQILLSTTDIRLSMELGSIFPQTSVPSDKTET